MVYILEITEWREIPGFPNIEVSTQGYIRSWLKPGNHTMRQQRAAEPHLLSCHISRNYKYFHVGPKFARANMSVHTAVALTFLGERPEGYDVCHKNGNKLDNRLTNLRYGTKVSNCADFKRHNPSYTPSCAKLSQDQVLLLRQSEGTIYELAEKYGMSAVNVWRAITGATYKNIPGAHPKPRWPKES